MARVALGYVSIPEDAADGTVEWWRQQLEEHAHRSGLELTEVYVDTSGHSEDGFYALVDAIRRAQAVAVVVPDLTHLTQVSCLIGAGTREAARYLRAGIVAVH